MMEKPLYMVLVFGAWTLTSFLCHFFAKTFLRGSASIVSHLHLNYGVIILTGTKVMFCLTLTQFPANTKTSNKTSKYVILLSHGLATLATNWSMSVTYAASTFGIKLIEPITGAVAQRLFLGVTLSYVHCLSIPLIVSGAIVFAAEDYEQVFKLSKGSTIAFMSNVSLAVRNVVIKKGHFSKSELKFTNKWNWYGLLGLCLSALMFAYYIETAENVPSGTTYLCCLLFMSSLFHVLYSYISTVIVLKHFSVVGHSVSNILKRLVVLGLLYTTGRRSASLWNYCGLVVCTIGLSLYAWIKGSNTNGSENVFGRTLSENVCGRTLKQMPIIKVWILRLLAASAGLCVVYLLRTNHLPGNWHSFRESFGNDGLNFLSSFNVDTSLTNKGNNQRSFLEEGDRFNLSDELFQVDLVKYPEQANTLSPHLTIRQNVITEAQRIHTNIFGKLLDGYKYAMLFEFAPSENKGDSAIGVGEMFLLRRLNVKLVFHCHEGACVKDNLEKAQAISKNYSNKELVILLHGGGNIIGYPQRDQARFNIIPTFVDFEIILFPQSIYYKDAPQHVELCKKVYASHNRLTFVWRDKVTYKLGKKLFPRVRSLLSPDMAYEIGFVPRFMAPTHDILWIKRMDDESPKYEVPKSMDGYRVHVADWLNWKTPRGTSSMEDMFLMTANGMMFLQRGRVVITDRLHGHILCTLLDIPHVYIDNKERKISNYHNTWTAGLDNILLANSSTDAVSLARNLIKKLDKVLPEIKGDFN